MRHFTIILVMTLLGHNLHSQNHNFGGISENNSLDTSTICSDNEEYIPKHLIGLEILPNPSEINVGVNNPSFLNPGQHQLQLDICRDNQNNVKLKKIVYSSSTISTTVYEIEVKDSANVNLPIEVISDDDYTGLKIDMIVQNDIISENFRIDVAFLN